MAKIQIKSKEQEVAKIHYKVICELGIYFYKIVKIASMREKSSTTGCKYFKVPPK